MNVINSTSLRIVTEKIASYLAQRESQYTIDQDNYWLVGADKWNDFSSCPEANEVGSLTDDWHSLQQLLDDSRTVDTTDLDRLAALLRAISEQIAPTQ